MDPTLDTANVAPSRARTLAPRLALVLLGLLLGAPFLWAGWQHRKPSARWQGHIALRDLDCSHPEICRLHANQALVRPHGGGGVFHIRSNALGFRGPDRPEQRAEPRTLRIQLYGDSFTYGIGADEGHTLSDELEAVLRARHPERPVEVQNFGLPANFLHSNLIAYRDFGRRYTPDLVVFVQNRLGGLLANDVNARVRQIRRSRLLSWLIKTGDWGRYLVNAYQVSNTDTFDRETARAEYAPLWKVVADDVAQRRLKLAAFSLIDSPGSAVALFADDLPITPIRSDLTDEQYRNGPYVIVGDGHPSPAGVRHYAALLADGIERMGLFAPPE